jgi:prepilin-type N-terminal cleavage/methylation domain-containing protein
VTRHGRRRRRFTGVRRDQSGFTLPELLVAMALETIIFGALATSFVVVLTGSDSVNDNLNKSSDARFAANYVISDARNSSGPEISLTDATSCPDPSPPVAGAQAAVARFNWNAPNAAGTATANITDYVIVSGSLMRRHCEGGTLVSDGVVANAIDTISVTCAPIADCSGNPTSITVTIAELPDKAGGPTFTYTLTAAFRKLVGGGSSLTPSPPQSLIVFGSGGCGVNITGSGTLKVYGNAFINTADNGACKALNLGGSGIWSAGATSILAGGTCVASGGQVCPTVTPYSPALVDPYAGLAAPTTAGRPSQTGCTGPVGAQTAQPGVYASLFSISGNTCTLASGIYILQAGFALGSSAAVQTAAGGVLIYITGGAFTVGGSASLTLTAMTTGPYAGLALWQSAADASTISWSGGGTLVFNGALYAPKAQLNVGGNAATPKATSIIVQTIALSGTGNIAIGGSAVPLSISAPASLAAWTVNRPYPSATLTPAGGDGFYAWSATGLPNGMSINASTGVISGTPTVSGAAPVTVTLNDALGDDPATQPYTLMINATLAITTASPLPGAQKTIPYSTTLAGSGGTAAFTWSATGVPAGLAINASTGVVSGTPTATGTSIISVTLTDSSGATISKDLALTVGPIPPLISSVTLGNAAAGTAGKIEKNDTITVVFSAQMKVSSICSTWITDTSNQNLVANSDVTVTLTDGTSPTHDTLSVTSASCTFNFGTLDLGVSTYIGGGSATFGGSGAAKSTVAWTTATHTLVITLGTQAGTGTTATVATSTPIYTAGAVQDSTGVTLGNSPFTLAAGQKF